MGSASAMESIDRVLNKHGRQIERELRRKHRSKLIRRFLLSNELYSIGVDAELADGTRLALSPLDIDDLAERFPDCRVGY